MKLSLSCFSDMRSFMWTFPAGNSWFQLLRHHTNASFEQTFDVLVFYIVKIFSCSLFDFSSISGHCHRTLRPWQRCSTCPPVWRRGGRSSVHHLTNHCVCCRMPRVRCFDAHARFCVLLKLVGCWIFCFVFSIFIFCFLSCFQFVHQRGPSR